MLTSLFTVLGLFALRVGLPVIGILLLCEVLHYIEARWNADNSQVARDEDRLTGEGETRYADGHAS